MEQVLGSVARIVDCMSDDELQDITFSTFLRRVAFITASGESDPVVQRRINYAIQLLWELLEKSSHSMKRKFAKYVGDESHLMIFTLENMCTSLKSYCKSHSYSRRQIKVPIPYS